MKKKPIWTEAVFRALLPCKDGLLFAEERGFDWGVIWRECERGDWLIWMAREAGALDNPTAARIAVACAEHVLPHWEKRHPSDGRPREAIEAAKAWVENPCEETRQKAYAAACAASAAATHTTSPDYAAFAAAYAAAYTAFATDADFSPAFAAEAAARAAADCEAERKWQADLIREMMECPVAMEQNSPLPADQFKENKTP